MIARFELGDQKIRLHEARTKVFDPALELAKRILHHVGDIRGLRGRDPEALERLQRAIKRRQRGEITAQMRRAVRGDAQ